MQDYVPSRFTETLIALKVNMIRNPTVPRWYKTFTIMTFDLSRIAAPIFAIAGIIFTGVLLLLYIKGMLRGTERWFAFLSLVLPVMITVFFFHGYRVSKYIARRLRDEMKDAARPSPEGGAEPGAHEKLDCAGNMNKEQRRKMLMSFPADVRLQCMARIQRRLVLPPVVLAFLAIIVTVIIMRLILREPSREQEIVAILVFSLMIVGLVIASMVLRAPRICDEEIQRAQQNLGSPPHNRSEPQG
ncbi:MAG: hypothetical protein C0404_05650 [Verrucomicrobia bacterium]|nr:hypothetical protein [Verrucomicrobiota bacterium]